MEKLGHSKNLPKTTMGAEMEPLQSVPKTVAYGGLRPLPPNVQIHTGNCANSIDEWKETC